MEFCANGLNRRSFLTRAALGAILASASPIQIAGQQQAPAPAPPDPTDPPMFVDGPALKWERMAPDAGEWSPEIVILHVAPKTKATELMIRVPAGQHVPPHWHSANETHTIVSGAFIMECNGHKAELGPGGFNYMPARMVHQAWTKPDSGAVLFITVDGAWDVNFLTPPKFGKPVK
ncbi:MAG: cupin domain-containing protein [Acidobacteria bacterium]|nr:cupin domain-containing protein [Acidobacteriota bacterium]